MEGVMRTCDVCHGLDDVQAHWPTCRHCGNEACVVCIVDDTHRREDNTAGCRECQDDAMCDCGAEITTGNPRRFDESAHDEPSWIERGCATCLPKGQRVVDPDEPTKAEYWADIRLSDPHFFD